MLSIPKMCPEKCPLCKSNINIYIWAITFRTILRVISKFGKCNQVMGWHRCMHVRDCKHEAISNAEIKAI